VQDCKAGTTVTSTAACREAGYIVDAGVGVPARPGLAADYYRLGCSRRDDLSCVRLATLQSLGRGVPRDADAALAVLGPACVSGLQEACFRLGLHLSATGVAADRRRAREVLEASCTAQFAESCAALKKLPPGW
jgi:TPR repeat protein